MAKQKRVAIVGGHGRIALLAAPRLAAAGYAVDSLIRNPAHRGDVEAAGAASVLLDVECADVDVLAAAFDGVDTVVFSAGAGGGDPERTHAVDFEAAVRTMEAAQRAGVARYVMVSYVRSETDIDRLDPTDSFYPYARAKHDADTHLRATGLDYTILGPGALTLETASEAITVVNGAGNLGTRELPAQEKVVSRANVAAVITHVVVAGAARRRTVNFYDGATPIPEALGR